MKLDQINDDSNQITRTVFQRKNGKLKVLNVPIRQNVEQSKHPMFPIARDRARDTDDE